MACINMLNKIIKHAQLVNVEEFRDKEDKFVEKLEKAITCLILICPHL